MSPKHRITLTLGVDLMEILRKIKVRDGISEADQVSEALRLWCQSHDFGNEPKDLMREAVRICRQVKRTQARKTSSRSK